VVGRLEACRLASTLVVVLGKDASRSSLVEGCSMRRRSAVLSALGPTTMNRNQHLYCYQTVCGEELTR